MARYLVVARTVTRRAELPPAHLPKRVRNVHEVTWLPINQRQQLVVLTVRCRSEEDAIRAGRLFLFCRGTSAEVERVERLRPARRRRKLAVPALRSGLGRGDSGPGDAGGSAGVREPRRPKPAPPHLSAARDLPKATDVPA